MMTDIGKGKLSEGLASTDRSSHRRLKLKLHVLQNLGAVWRLILVSHLVSPLETAAVRIGWTQCLFEKSYPVDHLIDSHFTDLNSAHLDITPSAGRFLFHSFIIHNLQNLQ
jgi:hypothetical protein